MGTATLLTTMHWGTHQIRAENGRLVGVAPWTGDPDTSPMGPLAPVTAFDPPATIDLSDASRLPGRKDLS
ncbi:hypothetical protein P9273_19845 [Mesorhizobium sp. WSM4935]|uniref:hypothetical protein n=1 Tax=Mesorhizobium sp. WSM4935 TaxID=3038547 RepID=UPI002414D239|nr:hypothetical protein [Mesorhizobium sp. WSM4935]MDG4877353.1 hypothetical protein [Mesorhizobium sp. WSM4935]